MDFLDAGDGRVAVAERTARHRRFVAATMSQTWNATPLELFLALAPRGTRAPEALIRDHEAYLRQSGASPAPARDLTAQIALLDLDDPGIDTFNCDPFGENWYEIWHDTFDGMVDTVKTAHVHQFAVDPHYRFYPGGYYNANGTITPGYNRVTYLGACNGDETDPLTMEVQRRIAYHTPQGTTYAWAPVVEVSLDYNQKFTFHSNIPASYRGRLSSDEVVGHLSFAVAYSKGFGLTSGS